MPMFIQGVDQNLSKQKIFLKMFQIFLNIQDLLHNTLKYVRKVRWESLKKNSIYKL